jgi:hypothetical protein
MLQDYQEQTLEVPPAVFPPDEQFTEVVQSNVHGKKLKSK